MRPSRRRTKPDGCSSQRLLLLRGPLRNLEGPSETAHPGVVQVTSGGPGHAHRFLNMYRLRASFAALALLGGCVAAPTDSSGGGGGSGAVAVRVQAWDRTRVSKAGVRFPLTTPGTARSIRTRWIRTRMR